ncbi:MAG TPA: hypothetical protein VK856_07970 [Anaerolineaceae bacterium]|nr:hypothetical protein [Anaerolineaceae bacterium]
MKKHTFLSFLFCTFIILSLSACTMLKPERSNTSPPDPQPGKPTAESELVVTDTPSTESDGKTTIYLVEIEDAGISGKKIGCDDSLIPEEVPTNSTLDFPWNAVETLLKLDQDFVSDEGFYNAFYQSDLELVQFELNNRSAQVYLEGVMMLGGVCDTPRIEEQLYTTILQSDQIDEVKIYINGELLEEYLSLK